MSEIARQDTHGQEVDARTPQQQLLSKIRSDRFQEQIEAALPATVTPQRFIRAAATALLDNPDLANARLDTLFASLLKCAQDGLLPDGREAAIVLYKRDAQYLPMVGGYRKIAGEHGWQIVARVVYQADEFEFEQGFEPRLRHVPARPGVDRGQRVAAYAVAQHRDGRRAHPVVMTAQEIDERRKKAQTDMVWKQWTDRMYEKTVAKAIFKELPLETLDPRVQRLIEARDNPEQAEALMYGTGRPPLALVDQTTGVIHDETPPAEPPADQAAGDAHSSRDPAAAPLDDIDQLPFGDA